MSITWLWVFCRAIFKVSIPVFEPPCGMQHTSHNITHMILLIPEAWDLDSGSWGFQNVLG